MGFNLEKKKKEEKCCFNCGGEIVLDLRPKARSKVCVPCSVDECKIIATKKTKEMLKRLSSPFSSIG